MLHMLGSHKAAFRELCAKLCQPFGRDGQEPVEYLLTTLSDAAWCSASLIIRDASFNTLLTEPDAHHLLLCLVREAGHFRDDHVLTLSALYSCPNWKEADGSSISSTRILSAARTLREAGWIEDVPELRGWRLLVLLHRFAKWRQWVIEQGKQYPCDLGYSEE